MAHRLQWLVAFSIEYLCHVVALFELQDVKDTLPSRDKWLILFSFRVLSFLINVTAVNILTLVLILLGYNSFDLFLAHLKQAKVCQFHHQLVANKMFALEDFKHTLPDDFKRFSMCSRIVEQFSLDSRLDADQLVLRLN